MGASWRVIHDSLLGQIASGRLADGERIPTEVELKDRFGVGRHSVRRAMAALAAEGLLSVEQGRGTFVRRQPSILYRIGSRTRFRENLLSQGLKPGGDHIAAEVIPAPPGAAEALGLAEGSAVHRVLRRGRADGVPISLGLSFHSTLRFPDLGARREAGESVTEIYRSHGITDYRRRDTELFARLPEGWEARLLEQHPDQPVMVQRKTDVTREGEPIGHSEAVWSAGRVRFSLECGGADA